MSASKQIIALDVGARSAKLIWMSLRGDTPVVSRTESIALPMGGEDPHELISAWINSLGLSKHFCATSLPGTEAVFQCGRIMPNDPRTPEEVAAMDIAQFSEMAGDEMRYDVFAFEPPNEVNTRRYLMTMARPATIQESIRESNLNNIRPADIIAAPIALYNAIEFWAERHDQPWCAINIGHDRTEIEIGLKEGILFARSIPLGGKIFTDAVMKETGLPVAQAEVRKHNDCGLGECDACFEALRPAADRWTAQLNACMGVYRSQFQDRKMSVTKVILCGGGAQLHGFRNYLAMKLALPVITLPELRGEVAEPVQPPPLPPPIKLGAKPHLAPQAPETETPPPVTHPNPPTETLQHESASPVPPGFEIAFGLGLTALHAGAAYLSLLPEELKDEVIFKQKKPWWIASGIFLLLAMAIYSITGVVLIHRDRALLEQEQEKLKTRERIDNQIQQTRYRCSQFVTNTVPLNELLINGPLARDVLTLVASTVDPNDWITLFCDEKIYNPMEQEQEENVKKAAEAVSRPVFTMFRSLRPRKKAASHLALPATGNVNTEEKKKELTPALKSIFIVEGYTPNPSLKSVREMIERLKTAPEIKRVDLRSDDKVLRPTGIPELENEKIPDFKRFVIEIEVNRS